VIKDCTKFDRNQTIGGCDDLARFAVGYVL